jgi:hypothetical protein
LATTLPSISRVLNQVEQDVKHIPERIPVVQVPIPPVPDPPTIAIPTSEPMPKINTSPEEVQPTLPILPKMDAKPTTPLQETSAIHASDDQSAHSIYSLTDQVRSEDIPSLESLLKKILRSRRVTKVSDEEVTPNTKAKGDAVRDLKQDIRILRHSKDASTSPPPSHTRRDLEKRYRKSKATKAPVTCECTSGYSQVSWVCPGCITDSSQSIGALRNPKAMNQIPNKVVPLLKPKDPSILFANDTSMIHPLAQIVAELEREEADLDADDLEVLSSLNGFQ